MAVIIRHYGIMKGQKIYLHNLPLYHKNADSLEAKRIEFTIKELHEKPSSDLHAYYRGGVVESAMEANCFGGWDADMIHAELANLFLGIDKMVVYTRKDGSAVQKIIREVRSLADLSQKEMVAYVERCIVFLAEEGVEVLSSDQYKLNKFKTRYDKPND